MIMPKLSVSTYPEMLRKLSTAVLFTTIVCTLILRAQVHVIDEFLKQLDVFTPDVPIFGTIKIPFGTFVVGFIAAAISESIKLHDKISNLLGIRAEFDVRWILMPTVILSGSSLSSAQSMKLELERLRLMGEVFYKFASSTPGKQLIDPHTITQALTAWSWYWLCAEAIVIIGITSVVLAWAGENGWALILSALILSLLLAMRFFRADCSKYALSQIQQILNDGGRKAEIVAVLNAL